MSYIEQEIMVMYVLGNKVGISGFFEDFDTINFILVCDFRVGVQKGLIIC